MAAGGSPLVPFATPLAPSPQRISDLPASGLPVPALPSGGAYTEPYTTAGTPTAASATISPVAQDTLSSTPPAVTPAGTGAGTPNSVTAHTYPVSNPALLPVYAAGTTYAANAVVGRIPATAVYELYYNLSGTKTAAGLWAVGTTYAYENVVWDASGNVWQSLVGGNVGNTPSTSPTQWRQIYTTWSPEITWAVGNRVMLDGVIYKCMSTATTNAPDKDSTDWGSALTITANPWLVGSTYASGNYVVFGGALFKSLAGSNIGNVPGVPDSTWWVSIPFAKWSSEFDYSTVGQVVFHLGKFYALQSGHSTVRTNPKVSNQLMDLFDQPGTLLWNATGSGTMYEAWISMAGGNVGNSPENTSGTNWNPVIPGAAKLAVENSRVYPPFANSAGLEVEPWQTGQYFGGGLTTSLTARSDMGSVASLYIVTPQATLNTLSHTGTPSIDVIVGAKNAAGAVVPIGLAGVLTGSITFDTLSGEATLAQTDAHIFTVTGAGTGAGSDTVTIQIGNGVVFVQFSITLA